MGFHGGKQYRNNGGNATMEEESCRGGKTGWYSGDRSQNSEGRKTERSPRALTTKSPKADEREKKEVSRKGAKGAQVAVSGQRKQYSEDRRQNSVAGAGRTAFGDRLPHSGPPANSLIVYSLTACSARHTSFERASRSRSTARSATRRR
jgi:hypothetical protein